MSDDNVDKKILQFRVTGIRKRGRPNPRWTDSVESDLRNINEKTLRTKGRLEKCSPSVSSEAWGQQGWEKKCQRRMSSRC
ncbi:hypothetical protein TNCV_1617641 [Trichonephila clavipes]|nr:hypothetical protein TNCV_1617641 [Trichonephila clavipes]